MKNLYIVFLRESPTNWEEDVFEDLEGILNDLGEGVCKIERGPSETQKTILSFLEEFSNNMVVFVRTDTSEGRLSLLKHCKESKSISSYRILHESKTSLISANDYTEQLAETVINLMDI